MSLFRKITETVSKGVTTATEKAQMTVEITRLHAQISGKRKEIEKRHMEIGAIVFEGFAAGNGASDEAKVHAICEEIAGILREIDDLEERIMQLRNEKECECGRKVPYDTRFCPSCGHKFPEPAPSAADTVDQGEDPLAYDAGEAPQPAVEENPGRSALEEERSASDWADVGTPTLEVPPSPGWTSPDQTGDKVFCSNCGVKVEASARFCPSCGTQRS
ncbi:zinc-ribbon domain-containing protein [Cohnella caldifontis]|uniref:zinc-ribbon domain-containing protein n=1 Tax=Cohnella caldifontis TaxID=3027471 RepID=UPI0023EAB6EB|nr:zinc-ribbon domain-containing protein [Cohnella sp. YIM B05605]